MKLAIVPSARPDGMMELLDSIVETGQDWKVYVAAHEWPEDRLPELRRHPVVHRVDEGPRQIVWPERVRMMREERASVYMQLDDDMLALPSTKWDAMARYLLRNRHMGTITGNWAQYESMLPKKLAKMPRELDVIKKQPITNTAGGHMCRADVVALMWSTRRCPVGPYQFDDVQLGLVAYINGFTNARYLSSVCMHRILGAGGLKEVFKVDTGLIRNPVELITPRKSKPVYKNEAANYLMPSSRDLTQLAHNLHKMNRKRRFGT